MTFHPQPDLVMDDEDEDVPTCPLCLEELDATDRAVEACHCGYQVCLWCLHHIREQLNSRCPACRTPYQEQNFKYAEVNHEQAAKEAKERATAKKERERREKIREIEKERARAAAVSQQKAKNNLKHARILQKNLVYVIGLSLTLAREEVIRRADMFGKFGRMTRILVNRSHPFNTDAPGGPSISAYVQYVRDSDASAAVRGMNNAVLDGREIRCAIATTKYCDAYVRSAAASDPNAAHFCGNHNCMYYHSLSQEVTLTREEVLARQLGPPPPAHLFLPPDTRRQHPGIRIPHGSPPSNSRPIPSRPVINAAPTMGPISSAPAIHPPSAPLPNSSAPVINPPLHAVPNTFSSPLPSPRQPTPYLGRKPIHSASPHRTPPSSPQDALHVGPRISRSPPAKEGSVHRGPLPNLSLSAQASGPSSSTSRLISSTRWDAANHGHGTTRAQSRPGPSSSLDDLGKSRGRAPFSFPHENAPPGFEEPSSPPQTTSGLLRPPGFEAPRLNRATMDSRAEHDVAGLENGRQPSSTIAPPPGFGPGPTLKKDSAQENTNDVAAAWSQEASSDQVFLAKARRMRAGTVGQVGARQPQVAQDDPNARSELAQVLAKIGGDLGVSSEFHDVQTSSSFPPRGRTSQVISDGMRMPNPSQQLSAEPGHLDSLFGDQLSNSAFAQSSHTQPTPSFSASSRNHTGPHSSSQSFEAAFSSPLLRSPLPSVRPEVTATSRRSNSRFGFARVSSPEPPSVPVMKPSASLSFPASSSTMTSLMNPIGNSRNQHRQRVLHTSGSRVNGSSSPRMPASTEPTQVHAPKPPQVTSRQARSRFDFADQGSSPPKTSQMLQADSRAGLPQSRSRMRQSQSSSMSSAKPSVNDAFIVSFAQLSREEKLASLFNSAQWSADQLPPMPIVDTQPDSALPVNTSTTSMTEFTANGANHNPIRNPSAPNRHQAPHADTNERMPPPAPVRPVQFHPPGFREATPGNTPETSTVDNTSASSDVATTVASGGLVSTATSMKDNSISNNVNEPTSSGGESVEDDRKRSRAQRKRDKKARQVHETVDRKSSAIREPVSKPLHVTQQLQATPPVQVPQPVQRQAAQTVIPMQPSGPDPSVPQAQAVETGPASDEATSTVKDQATATPSEDKMHAVRDPMQDANIPVPTLQHNDASVVILPSKGNDENDKFMSVSELEKEVEAARAREAQLQDKLLELQRRIRSYDNVRT